MRKVLVAHVDPDTKSAIVREFREGRTRQELADQYQMPRGAITAILDEGGASTTGIYKRYASNAVYVRIAEWASAQLDGRQIAATLLRAIADHGEAVLETVDAAVEGALEVARAYEVTELALTY